MVSSLLTTLASFATPGVNTPSPLSDVGGIVPEAPSLNIILPTTLASILTAAFLLRARFKDMPLLPQRLSSRASETHQPELKMPAGRTNVYVFPHRTSVVEAASVRLQDRQAGEWDAFAQSCGASFRSAHNWLRGWSVKAWPHQKLQLIEFYVSGCKIGQCAIGVGRDERTFLDGLAIRPDYHSLWASCMEAVLCRLGPGKYRYGWNLNLEPSREEDLRSIPGVAVESVHPVTVHAVDFRRWRDWDEYWKSTSNNTRRNAKRGEQSGLRIVIRTGLGGLLQAGAIARLRSVMYERKGLKFQRLTALASYVGGHVIAPQYRLTVIAMDGRSPQAGFVGYEFGAHTYYVAGGSQSANNGVAWYLQKLMLHRAWVRTQGQAKFIMGHVDYSTHDEAVGGGLLRSRRSVNVSEYETSTVVFRYSGGIAPSVGTSLSS